MPTRTYNSTVVLRVFAFRNSNTSGASQVPEAELKEKIMGALRTLRYSGSFSNPDNQVYLYTDPEDNPTGYDCTKILRVIHA